MTDTTDPRDPPTPERMKALFGDWFMESDGLWHNERTGESMENPWPRAGLPTNRGDGSDRQKGT